MVINFDKNGSLIMGDRILPATGKGMMNGTIEPLDHPFLSERRQGQPVDLSPGFSQPTTS
jgi:hypothetical protein